MICRECAKAIPVTFDWFNDYRDTRAWLAHESLASIGGPVIKNAEYALAMLDAGWAVYREKHLEEASQATSRL